MGNLISKCFSLISHKNYEFPFETYGDIPEFSHPFFTLANITPDMLGRTIGKFKKLAVDNDLNLIAIIKNASAIEQCPGVLDWEQSKNMNKTELIRYLQLFVKKNEKIQFYGETCSAEIQELIDELVPMLPPLLWTQDQTCFKIGMPDLKYVSTGLKNKILLASVKPKATATIICGSNGVTKFPFGLVYPTYSKSASNNREFLRQAINGTNAIPNDALLWANENGYCDGEIMSDYYRYCVRIMPDLPTFLTHDVASPNVADQAVNTLHEMQCVDRLCPSNLTGDLAELDDLFMASLKNGTANADGLKVALSNFYQGIPTASGHVAIKRRDGFLELISIKILYLLIKHEYDKIYHALIEKSFDRSGSLMPQHLPYAQISKCKSFILRLFLTKIETIPCLKIRQQENTLKKAKQIVTELEKKLDKKRNGWECLAEKCKKKFKTKKQQQKHTDSCRHWKNFSKSRLECMKKAAEYHSTKAKKKASKKKADKIRVQYGRKTTYYFKCPSSACDFHVKNWYYVNNKRKILQHVSKCQFLTNEEFRRLIYTHNLFKKKK